MKPSLSFLVLSKNGDATALAEVGCRRAAELGLQAEHIPVTTESAPGLVNDNESVTVIVPVEFTGAQHEAWCLICQLSLLRCGVRFTILVLGAAGCAAFEVRQRAMFSATTVVSHRRRRAAA